MQEVQTLKLIVEESAEAARATLDRQTTQVADSFRYS
jgi:hypothetical protein